MIKVIELFGGIGACTAALKRIGIPFTVLDYVEIDKYAVKSYNALNGTAFEPQDITKWDKTFADVDLIMHGSPCQDFSSAGNQAGGDKDSGTRSSLMWHTVRIVEKLKPRYVVWENVKNLLSKKHRHNFDEYLSQMADLGYTNYYKVLNAKDYGIPQNRERVFTISVLNNRDFTFPEGFPLNMRLKDLLEKDVDKKYYLSESIQQRFKLTDDTMSKNIVGTTLGEDCTRKGERDIVYNDNGVMGALAATDYKQPKQIIQAGDLNHYNNDQMNRVYSPDGISPSVMTKSGGDVKLK